MREDNGLQFVRLHAFFDSDAGNHDQFGSRITQQVGADDRFVFGQDQLADAVPLFVFGNKAAGDLVLPTPAISGLV